MSTRRWRAVLAAAALGAISFPGAGCSSIGCYLESRALDLWDILPVSVKHSGGDVFEVPTIGIGASVKATPFFFTGLGYHRARAYGMALRRWGAVWEEGSVGMLLLAAKREKLQAVPSDNRYPPFYPSRWPGGPDRSAEQWSKEWNPSRESWNALIVLPFEFSLQPRIKLPYWRTWLDMEADVFVGVVGLGIGFSPAQIIDFLAGIVGVDPLGDDVDGRLEQKMRQKLPVEPTKERGSGNDCARRP